MKEKESSAAYFFKERGKTTITKGTEAAAKRPKVFVCGEREEAAAAPNSCWCL